jgi:hypothetical protein
MQIGRQVIEELQGNITRTSEVHILELRISHEKSVSVQRTRAIVLV